MSTSKDEDVGAFIEKRLKLDQRVYGNRRIEKTRHRRPSNIENVPTTLKVNKNKDKYVGPPILILDNGAYTTKIGMSTDDAPTILPNCIMKVKSERKRFFVGNQIEECRDLSGLYYLLPCEKGYTVRWNVQKPVWDYIFNNICPIEDKPIIMTQPMFNFKPIQEITDEIFFEEYEIKSMFRINPNDLAKYEYLNNVVGRNVPCIVVDSGFSFTTVVPYIGGKKYYKAARRINLGGKMLTNYLKDIISYRQLHVMDETYVINQVKEDTCYVTPNFKEDMRIASSYGSANTIIKSYVLPDFNNIRRGYVQQLGENTDEIAEGCQILRLNNERFTVPELLFHPSDIGIESVGIVECIVKCIQLCPLKDRPGLAKNIVLIGGNANFPGFRERVYADLRSYLPDHWTVNVYKPENPITFAWQGGKSLASNPKIKSLLITKEQYEERGSAYTYERFSDWLRSDRQLHQEEPKSTNTVATNSVLQSGHFSRFDLFGKHELETEELCDTDDNSASDKLSKESNGDVKSDSSIDAVKEKDSENNDNSPETTLEAQPEDTGESSNTNKINDKVSKHKAFIKIDNKDVRSSEPNVFASYDFNLLCNSFI
ncbi:hypothetical protein RN001_001730 [Aquatica leii]|uniref:Actin-related protein 6 n=1 Tax=Aquatica leii TaxID=1421715 RepID=A0AAN7PG95_9COLE|nr:hypothetical protein RN001_001730 [Aquatica leii]